MKRGLSESSCLDRVKKGTVETTLSGKHRLSNETVRKCGYGLHCMNNSDDDVALLGNVIMNCKPNPEPNNFPDFVFANGFVEHFRVSATDTDDKGFASIAEKMKKRNESKRKLENANRTYLKENPGEQSCASFHTVMYKPPVQSGNTFVTSFKRHWENHIASLQNYKGPRDIGIFMIECNDVGFSMFENMDGVFPKEGVCVGDFREEPKHFRVPRLSRWDELLDYMHGYRFDIKYVIYVCRDAVEFFRTDELLYIKGLIRHPYYKNDDMNLAMQFTACKKNRDEN